MTREEAKYFLPIIKAYSEGKTIELCCDSGATWIYDDDPSFKLGRCYRIKPESKYRPFKDKEECWHEMQKHQPFGWIYHKVDSCYEPLRISISDETNFMALFNHLTFADGTPFGILEN